MSFTIEHEVQVLLWVVKKSIWNVHEWQCLFVAQCIRWISALVGLQSALVNYIANGILPSAETSETAGQNIACDTRTITSTV